MFSRIFKRNKTKPFKPVVCSECFTDMGLKLDARENGNETKDACVNCGSISGVKLDHDQMLSLAYRFFVWGSIHRLDYGGAPVVQFNEHQKTDISVNPDLDKDVEIFEEKLGIGFFHYGPRLWMVGEVEPLKELVDPTSRSIIIERILSEYPTSFFYCDDEPFFRIRTNPSAPNSDAQYDSAPISGAGRFDSSDTPILYCSPDLKTCIHECRVTVEDQLYVASLVPTRRLKLLDLSFVLMHEDTTEFESLDMAVHMLSLAGDHCYGVCRDIAKAIRKAGYDGFVYSSYFSLIRVGAVPFQTAYGLSTRRISPDSAMSTTAQNIGLFGHPIADGKIRTKCINKLILRHVDYKYHFSAADGF